MVRSQAVDRERKVTRIELLANLSWTLDRLAGFFLVLSTVTLLVALLPTLLGYWPIMIAAIVHLAIVGWCFRLAWRGNWARQDISIDDSHIRVHTRTLKFESQIEWPVQWARAMTETYRGETRAFLVLHDKRFEIARFLPNIERVEAINLIERALAPHSAWRTRCSNGAASSG